MDVQFVAVLSRPADIIEDLPLGIVTGGEPFAMNLEKQLDTEFKNKQDEAVFRRCEFIRT